MGPAFTPSGPPLRIDLAISGQHPDIPPERAWPVPPGLEYECQHNSIEGEDDFGGHDAWSSTSPSDGQPRWLTAVAAWYQPTESPPSAIDSSWIPTQGHHYSVEDVRHKQRHRPATNSVESVPRPEGATSKLAAAVATADGSLWFFSEPQQLRRVSALNAGPVQVTSGDSLSPSPSVASSTRRGSIIREAQHSAPPFAGFHHHSQPHEAEHAGEGSVALSPTSGVAPSASFASSSAGGSTTRTQRAGLEALESRLEAQYHSGSGHRETVVGGVMEALGLTKHHHNHSNQFNRDIPSPRDRQTRPASQVLRSPSLTTASIAVSRSSSLDGVKSASISSTRPHQAPTSEQTVTGSASGSLSTQQAESRDLQRSRSSSSSKLGRQRTEVEGTSAPEVGEEEPNGQNSEPGLRLLTKLSSSALDPTPVVAVLPCRSAPPSQLVDLLLILHRGGLLTAWSLTGSVPIDNVDLASPKSVFALQQDKTSGIETNQIGPLTVSGGFVSSTIAALRSHTSSPSPATLTLQRRGTPSELRSRVSHNNLNRHDAGQQNTSQEVLEAFIRKPRVFSNMRSVLAPGGHLVACLDAAANELLFVMLYDNSENGRNTASMQFVGSLPIQNTYSSCEASIARTHVASHTSPGAFSVTVCHLDKDCDAVHLHGLDFSADPGGREIHLASTKHRLCPLPTSEYGNFHGCVLLDATHVLAWTRETVALVSVSQAPSAHFDVLSVLSVSHLKDVEILAVGDERATAVLRSSNFFHSGQEDLHKLTIDLANESRAMSLCQCGRVAPSTLMSACAEVDGAFITASFVERRLTLREHFHSSPDKLCERTLYKSLEAQEGSREKVLGLLPLSMERIVAVLSPETLSMCTLKELVEGRIIPHLDTSSSHFASLTMLKMVEDPRNSSVKHIVAGFSSGNIAFWDSVTLRLLAQWTLFASGPINLVVFGKEDNTLRLNGCIAVISQDGSLAILAIDGLKMLYLIPGRGPEAPLQMIAVRADELMLLYRDGKARVWDITTQELRRSIGVEQAQSLLDDGAGAWGQHYVSEGVQQSEGQGSSSVLSPHPVPRRFHDSPSLSVNLRRALDAASKAVNSGIARDDPTDKLATPAAETPRPRPIRPASQKSHGARTSATTFGTSRAQEILRPLWALLWPHDALDKDVDAAARALFSVKEDESIRGDLLHIGCAVSDVGTLDKKAFERHLLSIGSIGQSLCFNAESTAVQFLALGAMLIIVSQVNLSEETILQAEAHSVLSHLVDTLPKRIPGFRSPSLPLIALHLVDSNTHIREAATQLFEQGLSVTPPSTIENLCQMWRDKLTEQALPGKAGKAGNSLRSAEARAQALAFLGFLSCRMFKSLDPNILKDVAIALLDTVKKGHAEIIIIGKTDHDHGAPTPAFTISRDTLLIALELSLHGFGIWQNYVDAMDLLRSLFALAMASDDQVSASRSHSAARACARKAVIKIAEEHTPLFMTTVHLNMLHASSPTSVTDVKDQVAMPASHHIALNPATSTSGSSALASVTASASITMRLVAFMVRLRPSLLYPNLPRLAEAVVKSLDPTQPATHRDAILPAATLMIGELVLAYGTISFHRGLQRLAIGTHEGAIVMYDLRSATRLFVLEGGHAGLSLDAISFSPDGRRLVSVSCREGKILGWKVGNSVVGWFKPGVMPRQGGEEAKEVAYKSLRFPRSSVNERADRRDQHVWRDEGQKVDFEWKTDRLVKVDVIDAAQTSEVNQPKTSVLFDVA